MIDVLLGSKTKVKILQMLAIYPEGLTRNKIAEYSLLHPNNIYDQIEDLFFFDIVIKEGKKYLLNQDHVLYETIKSFFQLLSEYTNQFVESMLPFIHAKLNQNYYVTGYFAASRYITPLDYVENILQIAILDHDYEFYNKKLALLNKIGNISYQESSAGKLNIFSEPVKEIPPDIRLEKVENNEIYLASVTRGIIDCFRFPGVSDYGKCLLLVQNDAEELLDFSLVEREYNKGLLPTELETVLLTLKNKEIGNFNQLLMKGIRKVESEKMIHTPLLLALNEAITTVKGTY